MLTNLHGRGAELESLLAQCQVGEHRPPRLVVLYGRRRVGKTFLLQHVRQRILDHGSSCVYVAATREASGAQLARLADTVEAAGFARPDSSNWAAFWAALTAATRNRPLTLLLDETPYLIESDVSWPSVLQAAWDAIRHDPATAHLTLVLTGSAISTMTNLVSSRGALYERPDQLMRLDPFDLPTAASFLGAESPITTIEAYAACDGYPLLLQRWDPKASTLDNLLRLAGDPMGALATNATTLLLDLGDVDATQRVLGAIGRGANTLKEINTRAGQRTERPLAVLERSGLVERVFPVGEDSPKSALLRIHDNYLRFWFNIVEPSQQLIDGGQGRAVIIDRMPRWDTLVAEVFEREARRHAARSLGGSAQVGEWWTHRPAQAQIDVLGHQRNRWTLVGEVKWKPTFTLADYRQLQRHLSVAGDRAGAVELIGWSQTSLSDEVRRINPSFRHCTAYEVCIT